SPGMLSKAQDRIRRLNLKQEQFALHEQDLLAIEANFLEGLIPQGIVPKVLMTLGVAGHPDRNPFWDHLFEALPVGTPITTMDVCCREGSLSARVISLIGSGKFNADIASFQAWERLKARCRDYEEKTYHPFNILRCSVIVATGRKPS
ncbi:MAG: hypothetical protein KC519_23125, partial [Anaerolineae bacterium]|nr:hypothetical protein [Anaerolineae bacterium]